MRQMALENPPSILPKDIPPQIQPPPPRPPGKLTRAGVVLVCSTVLATIGAALLFPFWVYPRFLPPGAYPRLLLALPVIFSGVAVAAIGSWLLKKLRIPTHVKSGDDPSAA